MDNYEETVADLKKRYKLHRSEIQAVHSDFQNSLIARWRSVAGIVADAMLESPSKALNEAKNPNGHQVIAIEILAKYWKISSVPEVLETLLDVIGSNSNEFVRATAIRAVSSGLAGTQNQFWLRFLAETVEKDNETKIVRSNAYFALFIIAGRTVPVEPDAIKLRRFNENFPCNVDWEFVNHCLVGITNWL